MSTFNMNPEILSRSLELKRQFRWVMSIDGIDAFLVRTTARPGGDFDEVAIDSLNSKKFISGKWTWGTIDMTMYDPIDPSAVDEVLAWLKLNYNPEDGTAGYEATYKKDIVLDMLDAAGESVEHIDLIGCWPKTFDPGSLDYSSSDDIRISVTLRFDNAKFS